jgi:hypothetical protein
MKANTTLTVLFLATVALVAACGGGGGGNDKENFTSFVKDLATTPVDDADPVAIDGLQFEFSNDPAAFDALFE